MLESYLIQCVCVCMCFSFLFWSLISAVGCTIFSNRNKCLASYANAVKHISNSSEIKAHACCLYCIHLSWIPHAICIWTVLLTKSIWVFRVFGLSFGQGNIFVIYFIQLLIFLKATNFSRMHSHSDYFANIIKPNTHTRIQPIAIH